MKTSVFASKEYFDGMGNVEHVKKEMLLLCDAFDEIERTVSVNSNSATSTSHQPQTNDDLLLAIVQMDQLIGASQPQLDLFDKSGRYHLGREYTLVYQDKFVQVILAVFSQSYETQLGKPYVYLLQTLSTFSEIVRAELEYPLPQSKNLQLALSAIDAFIDQNKRINPSFLELPYAISIRDNMQLIMGLQPVQTPLLKARETAIQRDSKQQVLASCRLQNSVSSAVERNQLKSPSEIRKGLSSWFESKQFQQAPYVQGFLGGGYQYDEPIPIVINIKNKPQIVNSLLLTELVENCSTTFIQSELIGGKSTLARQLVHAWSNAKNSRFEWVFILDLRTLPSDLISPTDPLTSSLDFMNWLLQQYYFEFMPSLSNFQKIQLMRHLCESDLQGKILFIIDGLDGFPEQSVELYTQFKNSINPIARILQSPCIIMGRQMQIASMLRFLDSPQKANYTLLGFRDHWELKKAYLNQTPISKTVKRQLLKELRQEPLNSLSDSPYFMFLICAYYHLWSQSSSSQASRAGLAQYIVRESLKRDINRNLIAFGFKEFKQLDRFITDEDYLNDSRVQMLLVTLARHGYCAQMYSSGDEPCDLNRGHYEFAHRYVNDRTVKQKPTIDDWDLIRQLIFRLGYLKSECPMYVVRHKYISSYFQLYFFAELLVYELKSPAYEESGNILDFKKYFLGSPGNVLKHKSELIFLMDRLTVPNEMLKGNKQQLYRSRCLAFLSYVIEQMVVQLQQTKQKNSRCFQIEAKQLWLLLVQCTNHYLRIINPGDLEKAEIYAALDNNILEPFIIEIVKQSSGNEHDDLDGENNSELLRNVTNFWQNNTIKEKIYNRLQGDTLEPYLKLLVWLGDSIKHLERHDKEQIELIDLHRVIRLAIKQCEDSEIKQRCKLLYKNIKHTIDLINGKPQELSEDTGDELSELSALVPVMLVNDAATMGFKDVRRSKRREDRQPSFFSSSAIAPQSDGSKVIDVGRKGCDLN